MTDQLSNPFISPLFHTKIPPGDDKLRRVCAHCEFIDYVNPKIVAGSVVTKGDRILLCRRAIEPRKGYWTLPAGFMEEGETVEEGARREAREEACADIRIEQLLAVYSVPRIAQVQVMFRAELMSDISAGPESEEVGLFAWKDIPWSELAFPTVIWALTHYAETRHLPAFPPFANPPGTEKLTH
ncbi:MULTISPECIES: NUDIX hydrolase [Hyphomonas]|uniref:NUDIX hydrolase n=1 Tax=Hyphomonas adhaerens TaxID=81029 RepID=A0A3B9GZ37_9PROT|nr:MULTISPECIES: NUDIX hydrolase [Hyphomonas]MBB39237.1 NUDIX hydrolase [Hyphomonas sp.]HAE27715.1 NUDIX hydrolase [Hyphomonas adhaerens]|tara:strand:- start:6065 stop:6616 length:552 start_codon:yes stop_codon:yes gene_type:complete